MRRTHTELLRLLEPGLEPEAATALLEEFETVDPDRLATKQDLEATLRSDLEATEAALRSDLGHQIDLLRNEMDGRFGQVDERFMRLSAEIGSTRHEVLAAIVAR